MKEFMQFLRSTRVRRLCACTLHSRTIDSEDSTDLLVHVGLYLGTILTAKLFFNIRYITLRGHKLGRINRLNAEPAL